MTAVKNRNMWVQVLLIIITFGLYAAYWFYQTAEELKFLAKDEYAQPTLWLILLIVPFGFIYSHYKYSELYEKVASDRLNKWILFLLWMFCTPAVWFIVQVELNKRAQLQA